MKPSILLIGMLTMLTGTAVAAPAAEPLLELRARTVAWGLVMPIPPVANIVVGTLDKSNAALLDSCVREQHLQPHNYRALLLSWNNPSSPGHRLYVVRGSEKLCGAFYGVKDFKYYLIDEQLGRPSSTFKLLLQGHGERLAVLPAVTNGFNEIEATGCNDGGCRIARMAFDRRQYRPVQCEESQVRGKSEVRRSRVCGSDATPDDQAPPTTRPKPSARR